MDKRTSVIKFINVAGFQCLDDLQNDSVDLYVNTCGIQSCSSGHCFGPGKRDTYIIHFISSGKGIYTVNGKTYKLTSGDFFLIYPDTEVYYEADKNEPWDYIWVGFQGIKAATYLKYAGLDKNNVTGHYNNVSFMLSCVQQMILARSFKSYNELKRTSALLQILAALIEDYSYTCPDEDDNNPKSSQEYLDMAINYIDEHITEDLKVSEIADYIGIDRSYLSTIFKRALNLSPQQYILHYRMNKAALLLKNNDLKISAIANEVGYADSLSFSKMFKKCKGVSPSEYRMDK